MDATHKEILRKHRLNLSNQLLIGDTIVHFLYQENILTENHVEEIQAQITNQKKTLRLLDILPTRGPRAFDIFLQSLEEEFIWIKDKLLRDLDSSAHERSLSSEAFSLEAMCLSVKKHSKHD